jgi:hypothetical protein
VVAPTKTPIGNNGVAVSLGEIWRNIITDLGGATPVDITEMDSILQALDLAMFNNRQMGIGQSNVGVTGSLYSTIPRNLANTATYAISTGTMILTGVYIPINTTVSNFNFMPGTTGDAGPTHQWMALFGATLNLLAISADATSTAITASTPVTYPVATTAAGASTSYITKGGAIHYLGLLIATANAPVLESFNTLVGANAATPVLSGTSNTGLTTPLTFPTTATAITATAGTPLMWVS